MILNKNLIKKIVARGTGQVPARLGLFYRVSEKLRIFFTDILPANFFCFFPNWVSWVYRTVWARSVRRYVLQGPKSSMTAHLFVHGQVRPDVNGRMAAVLLLPAEYSHPLAMLHLADIAQSEGRSVFSLHVNYDDKNPENHRLFIRQSIEHISQIALENRGTLTDLILVGHSRGALEAAHEAYVENNLKVSGVIAVAGRFEVIHPSSRPCRLSLEASVYAVWEKLQQRHQSLRVPFNQIAAGKDWCMDPEASITRRDHNHLSVNAGHVGVINHPSTLAQFRTWLHT